MGVFALGPLEVLELLLHGLAVNDDVPYLYHGEGVLVIVDVYPRPGRCQLVVRALALPHLPYVVAVYYPVCGKVHANHGKDCGEDVQAAGEVMVHNSAAACCKGAVHVGDEGHMGAAVELRGLSASLPAGRALVPGSVVAREEDKRVVQDALLLKLVHDFADAPVYLLHAVSVCAALGSAGIVLAYLRGPVRERGCIVEEERLVAACLFVYIVQDAGCELLGELGLVIGLVVHDIIVLIHAVRLHVVRIEGPVEVIESAVIGKLPLLHAQMPLAEERRVVPHGLQGLRKEDFVCGEAGVPVRVCAQDALQEACEVPADDLCVHVCAACERAQGISAGKQARPRCGTDGVGGVIVVKEYAVLGKIVYIGGAYGLGAGEAQVTEAHVVHKNEDNVLLLVCRTLFADCRQIVDSSLLLVVSLDVIVQRKERENYDQENNNANRNADGKNGFRFMAEFLAAHYFSPLYSLC